MKSDLMKKIKMMNNSLIGLLFIVLLSACSSSGSSSQTGLNLTGNWRAQTIVSDQTREVRLSLAQKAAATLGVKETTVDGNLLIDGVCVFSFSGGTLNLETATLTIAPGDDFSFIGTAKNNSIVGTFNSLDDDPTDNEGCGTFQSSITTFTRI